MDTTSQNGLMVDMVGTMYAHEAFTPVEAARVAALLSAQGVTASAVQIGDSCYGLRGYEVHISWVNSRAGNRSLHILAPEAGIDARRAKQIAAEAKRTFAGRDATAAKMRAAERELDRE